MKTTATAVVWRRVLSVCLLCALWGEGKADVVKKAKEAKELGEKAVTAQSAVAEKLKGHLPSLEAKATKVTEAAKKINEVEVKGALEAIESVRSGAQTLAQKAQDLLALVGEANKKSKEVVEGAKTADQAAELWKEAAQKATSQSSEMTKLLVAINTTMETALTTAKTVGNTTQQEKANVTDALEELRTALGNIIHDPRGPDILAQEAEKAVKAAMTASAQAAGKPIDWTRGDGAEENNQGDASQSQGSSGGTKSNDGGKTVTGNSSSDGISLTAFYLAATSVLLLFARVAAVMITA